MKTCTKCNETKPYTSFNKSKKNRDGHVTYCKECLKAYDQLRYTETNKKQGIVERQKMIRTYVVDHLKNNPCVTCGESDPIVLEFDHLDPSQKAFNIGHAINYGFDKVKEEMSKCRVLCANCHRRHTAKQRGFYCY